MKVLDFYEVDKGFNVCEAIEEAKRCLDCAKPTCRKGCPIENDIPGFIQALAKGNLGEAGEIIALRSNLPAICGRVCPHEKQCEATCVLAKKDKGIKIGKIERFIADFVAEAGINNPKKAFENRGKVAVIGSGPAGLTVAGDLAKLGFAVTVFEAQAEPGGILMYGIPEFRLSREVVRREVKLIEELGVVFKTNVMVGVDFTVDDMFAQGFDAIFMGTGTALPKTIELPGKDLPGIIQATYLLQTVTLAGNGEIDQKEIPVKAGDKVAIIGAGNVAIDAARTALRIGAEKVSIVYRKTKDSITALESEYEHAVEEGVHFQWLASPKAYVGKNKVEALECDVMEMDEKGKVVATGEIKRIPADVVILAIGQRPAARIVSTTTGIEVNEWGYVITKDRPYGMTTKPGVFAGGDVVHEPATVVLAMKEAKKVATGIAMYVDAKKLMDEMQG